MSRLVCTCCRTERTALHAHVRPCEMHSLGPVVPLPPTPLGEPGGEDCTGRSVREAVLSAYRARGGVAMALAYEAYGESLEDETGNG